MLLVICSISSSRRAWSSVRWFCRPSRFSSALSISFASFIARPARPAVVDALLSVERLIFFLPVSAVRGVAPKDMAV